MRTFTTCPGIGPKFRRGRSRVISLHREQETSLPHVSFVVFSPGSKLLLTNVLVVSASFFVCFLIKSRYVSFRKSVEVIFDRIGTR